jgi:hypothetical protein
MTEAIQPPKDEKNFSFSLLKAVERDFEAAIKSGCYQKKALLNKLFAIEIERLDAAIDTSVPQEITRHVRETQNDPSLTKRKMWVAQQVQLPSTLVDRIQDVCKNKGVVRDAWVNRVLFLATGNRLFNQLLPLDELEESQYFGDNRNNRQDAMKLTTQRLTASLDPLSRLHEAILDEPGIDEPRDLYRIKLFTKWRPKKPMSNILDTPQSEQDKGLRNQWLRHQFAWCITCWAEIEDLAQSEEPDWDDIL